MEWEIIPFVGMGPIRFGMSPADVANLVGVPETTDNRPNGIREFRAVDVPIVAYENGAVTEIEAFYDVKNVTFRGRNIFEENGLAILQFLERENGGASLDVGIVMFERIGITAGRLDEAVSGDHSITAFAKGLWDDSLEDFEAKSFI